MRFVTQYKPLIPGNQCSISNLTRLAGYNYPGFPPIYLGETGPGGDTHLLRTALIQKTHILSDEDEIQISEFIALAREKEAHKERKKNLKRELDTLEAHWRWWGWVELDPVKHDRYRKEWLTKRREYNSIKHWDQSKALLLDAIYNQLLDWVLE